MHDPTAAFETHRDRLLDLAYGMLGRVSTAEDVVQDAYLRWQDVDAETVDDPGAYLSTIVTRLSLDRLTSVRAERETYTGPWLPEPVVETDSREDSSGDSFRRPDASIERTGELSMALLVLLEQLRPIEGLERVTRFYFGIAPEPEEDVEVRPVRVNGRPGLLVLREGSVYSVMAFRVEDGQIQEVYTVMNPEKLQHLFLEEPV